MRIAHIIPDFRETFRRYDSETPEFHASVRALLSGFALCPESEVHVVSCFQRPVRSPDRLFPNVRFHALHVPKSGWLRTGYQGCVRATRAALKEIRPDIVHGQGTERYCAISAVLSGFPNLVTVRGNMRQVARVVRAKPLTYFWLTAILERLTLPRTQGIICISRYARDQVAGLNPKTWLAPNAAEPEFYEVCREAREPRLLCVSDIVEYKNQVSLIRALDELHSRRDFTLVLVGRLLPDSDYGKTFLREVQSRPWCRYDGLAGREQMKGLLAGATALVHPSLEDNCPMAVVEAMAAGVPVAASRIGGIPDLIEDGVTGLLFDPNDASDIRWAARRLLEDAPLAERFARTARERAMTQYHPRAIAERHLEIYREVLGAGR
ncbi:MAG: glycosyltransferase family 4 protein [Planctomycetota bacterium]